MALLTCLPLKVKSNLKLEISGLNYIHILVYIAFKDPFSGLQGDCSLQIASEVNSDLRIKISDLNYVYVPMV